MAEVRKDHDDLAKEHEALAKQVNDIDKRFLVMVAGSAGAATAIVQGILKFLGVH